MTGQLCSMRQDPAIFGVDSPALDDKLFADRVMVDPHRTYRKCGAHKNVVAFQNGADLLVHLMLDVP